MLPNLTSCGNHNYDVSVHDVVRIRIGERRNMRGCDARLHLVNLTIKMSAIKFQLDE